MVRITKKGGKDGGRDKSAEYSTLVWAEACMQFDEWYNLFDTDSAEKKLVAEDYFFISSKWEKNGYRYSGIHRFNEKNEIISNTGVNLDNYEWKQVFKSCDEINIALYGPQAAKGSKRKGNEVQYWTFGWFLNGKELNADVKVKKIRYFTEEGALKEGRECTPSRSPKEGDKLELRTETSFMPKPSETVLMKICLIRYLTAGVDILKTNACEACNADPFPLPSQIDHMKHRGCCSDTDFVEEFTDEVLKHVDEKYLALVYGFACRELQMSSYGSSVLAKAAKEYIPIENLKDILREDKATKGRIGDLDEDDDDDEELLGIGNFAFLDLASDGLYFTGAREALQTVLMKFE